MFRETFCDSKQKHSSNYLEVSSLPEGPTRAKTVYCSRQRGNNLTSHHIFSPLSSLPQGYHLNLSFPLPDYDAHYRASPGGQLSSLLGHRGQGSLLSYLRTKGLAHHVVARHKQFHSGRFSLMLVSIQMTDHGERHVDSIIKNVFQYINMLRKCLPSEEYFKELKLLTEQRFQMKEREKAVSAAEQYAHALSVYAPEDILTGDWCVTEHKPEVVMEMLERLRPDNLRVTILTKNAKYLETKVSPDVLIDIHPYNPSEVKMGSTAPELVQSDINYAKQSYKY